MKIQTVTVLVGCGALCSGLNAGSFDYPDFSSVKGLSIVGNAAQFESRLRLTPDAQFQAGAAWYAAAETVQFGFDTSFQFRLTHDSEPAGSQAADGFAFVVQNSPTGMLALGKDGMNLGYGGLSNSIAVEFDTNKNGWDPNGNHVAIQSCRAAANTADNVSRCALGITTQVPILKDTKVHRAEIIYKPGPPGALTISVDDHEVLTSDAPLDLTSLGLTGTGNAYVGFTAGTGAGFENHDILSWSFTSPDAAIRR